MNKKNYSLSKLGWRRIAFSLVVLIYLGFLGFINVMMFLPDNWISAMGHFNFFYTGNTHNFIHELVFALIVGTAAIGLLSQLWKPRENFAGQLVTLIIWGVMTLTATITNNWVPHPLFIIFGGLTLIATILHPAGFGLFNWIRATKVNKTLLMLVIIAAIPLFVFALININLQISGGGTAGFFNHNPPAFHSSSPDREPVNNIDGEADHYEKEHSNQGHYRNIAAISFIIILVALLASFNPRGRRVAAWIAGLLPVLLGIASIVLPEAESSLGITGGVIAIVWGIIFIVMDEKSKKL